jgi:FlaA1/EpsC-like NDP-sugar epimerase
MLRGARVMVTGAGGSIGAELCRQILHCEPASLALVGHGENSVFGIRSELAGLRGDRSGAGCRPCHAVIADVRDLDRLKQVFETHRPEIIFHAAAHKHVPLMEENVPEAVTNNVQGTVHLLRLAEAYGVDCFVLVSTDKAVNPTSVMGATKRVAELLVQEAARRCGRRYVAVRFGNVLGSRGSVVPLFRKQIAAGGPVTVTHPDVQRYFMTISEAAQLVLQAAALGKGGEVFLLDMGEPIRIVDLAEDLIRLSGLRVGQDIDVVFTGLRPGDKLSEELFVQSDEFVRTEHERILRLRNHGGCGEAQEQGAEGFEQRIEDLIALARVGDGAQIKSKLKELVPEYTPTAS